jgi:hypothetical protein
MAGLACIIIASGWLFKGAMGIPTGDLITFSLGAVR